jgi:hypothetical protein
MPRGRNRIRSWFFTLLLCPFVILIFAPAWFMLHFWIRSHNPELYYFRYPYFFFASLFLVLGLIALAATLYGAWRRSFYGILFLVSPLFALAIAVRLPDVMPHSAGRGYDTTYFSGIEFACNEWYSSHHRYPANDAEIKQAIGSTTQEEDMERFGIKLLKESQYRRQGQPVPYEIVVENGASGPHLTNISARPGLLYYSVSSDLQEYWITMTALAGDAPGNATLLKQTRMDKTGWIVHKSHDPR